MIKGGAPSWQRDLRSTAPFKQCRARNRECADKTIDNYCSTYSRRTVICGAARHFTETAQTLWLSHYRTDFFRCRFSALAPIFSRNQKQRISSFQRCYLSACCFRLFSWFDFLSDTMFLAALASANLACVEESAMAAVCGAPQYDDARTLSDAVKNELRAYFYV